ncbi:hypothetical protein PVAG01_07303 [Phlyctema vagabunda]|uniref:Peroxin 20 n=1 Tax=Phlyctema vagabunda TaxID=108571 RepID=A0ABR4PC18_9HELO
MADNFCGPSNALQNFQKHSTVDRTLQQDRLISRQSPSQGFRSSGPNTGFLDPEFEAFQAGQAPLQPLESQSFQHHGFAHASPNINQPGPSNWASDFQRLNISSPPPQFQQQPFNPPLQQQHSTGGWHQDFAQQQQQAQNRGMLSGQFDPGQSQMNHFSPMSAMSTVPRFAGPFMNAESQQIPMQQPAEAFDEEAFARAFEAASKSEIDSAQESDQRQDTELGQDILVNESAERFMENETVLDQRIGADLIHDPLKETQNQQHQDDPDALARTAGTLLASVAHDKSEKFQNSQFLELMRQLRDREAVVEGDKIVANGDAEEKLKVAEQ